MEEMIAKGVAPSGTTAAYSCESPCNSLCWLFCFLAKQHYITMFFDNLKIRFYFLSHKLC